MERAQEIKVTIEGTYKKVGNMFIGPSLGFKERSGIDYEAAS